MLVVVSGAYAVSLALVNGCTGGSSSLSTSSGVVGRGGGCQAAVTSGGTGVAGVGAGVGAGRLAGIRVSKARLGS